MSMVDAILEIDTFRKLEEIVARKNLKSDRKAQHQFILNLIRNSDYSDEDIAELVDLPPKAIEEIRTSQPARFTKSNEQATMMHLSFRFDGELVFPEQIAMHKAGNGQPSSVYYKRIETEPHEAETPTVVDLLASLRYKHQIAKAIEEARLLVAAKLLFYEDLEVEDVAKVTDLPLDYLKELIAKGHGK